MLMMMAIMICFFSCTTNSVEKTPDEIVSNAIEMYENENYDGAKELFEEVLSDYSESEYSKQCNTSLLYIDSILIKESEIIEIKRIEDSIHYTNTLKIVQLYPSTPNSAGGVDLNIVWTNKGETIKYAIFSVSAYNAVDDKVYCTIRDISTVRAQVTGPIDKGQTNGYGSYWSCMWYNWSVKKIKIDKIELEYMNGETEIIEGDNIRFVL